LGAFFVLCVLPPLAGKDQIRIRANSIINAGLDGIGWYGVIFERKTSTLSPWPHEKPHFYLSKYKYPPGS
jgi:hypothetical protein